jgi:tetratricopeptide (TPR) repeat protein
VSQERFIQSIAVNIAFWCEHEGLEDPWAWTALDRERQNLFRAVEYGLRRSETWSAAANLALKCYTYIFERGYWSEWSLMLEEALSACPAEEMAVKGRLVQHLGSFYRKQRRLDEAQSAHEQAEAIGRALEDPFLVALAHLGLGRVYFRRRQYDRAEEYARFALAEFEAGGSHPGRAANARNLLGIITAGRGDYEEAASELYRARELFRQTGNEIELGRTTCNLCDALSRLGRVDEVLELHEEAAAIFEAYDKQLDLSLIYVNLGFLHYSQGQLAEAGAAFRQAYTPAIRRAGPVYYASLIEMNLGNVLLLQGDVEEARAYFLGAVKGFRLVNAKTMLANSMHGLAEVTLAAGEREEAVALLEDALAIVAAIPEDAFAKRMEKRFRGLLEGLRSPPEREK